MNVNKGFGKGRKWPLTAVLAVFLVAYFELATPVYLAPSPSALAEEGDSSSEATEAKSDEAETKDTPEPEPEKKVEQEEVEEGSSGEEEEPKEEEAQEEKPKEDDKQPPPKKKRIIGATAEILEKGSGLIFKARVDTGAKSCSLHVEEMKIVGEEEGFKPNIGKVVRFKVRNSDNKTRLVERRIETYVIIKTAGKRERRYKVPLTLSWKGGAVEKKVLVTLNDRNGMNYPLLLGRNFLRGEFLVDVEVNSDD